MRNGRFGTIVRLFTGRATAAVSAVAVGVVAAGGVVAVVAVAVVAVAVAPTSARALETTPSWSGEGNQASAHAGWSVAPAGDVDGDGYTDLLVGARDHDAGQTNEGRVVLYRGSASGPSLAFDWKAEGDQLLAFFASSVAPAGDVNGDGYADIIVGAPSWDGDLQNEGGAFAYYGSPTGLPLAASWSAEGDQAAAAFGGCVAGAGDVNGDGYDDVIVGARGYDASFDAGGRAVVYLGGPSGLATTPAWSVTGDQTDAALGVSVAGAGDVNGDGYADVIVGAFLRDAGEANEGCAFVYLGSPLGLSTTPAWTGEGNAAGAGFGWSVAGAGDVDGDGYADVIVGARDQTVTLTNEGRVWLFRGSASGINPVSPWHADGGQASAFLGWSVATAGDVNGDGYADVIVGAYKADVMWTDDGAARVYLGGPSGLAAAPAWTATSAQAGAQFGYSVSGAGDVDGDGYGDIVVGAIFQDAGQADEGVAYLYRGGAELPQATAAWRGSGGPAAVTWGFATAAGGDVNGDGYHDLLVSDPFSTTSGEGRVDLVFGSEPLPDTSPAWSVTGSTGEGLGRAIAFAGDVNGDGCDDVLLGAPFATDSYATEGRFALYLGSVFGPGGSAAFASIGGATGAELGAAVAGAGDVNGDGFADFLVGAPGADGLAAGSGIVRVVHGKSASPYAQFAATLPGPVGGGRYGAAVAAAGDVNGDGFSDILIGEPYASLGGFEEGRAHLRLGSTTGVGAADAWSFGGTQNEAHLGEVVATAGDVNADGYSDVLVLAPDHDASVAGEGRAYLFLGGAAGLAASPVWEWSPGQASARMDAAAAAGDVNGDGYGDVVLGISRWDGTLVDEGRVVLFLGNAGGLAASPARAWLGGVASARLGCSLGGRGDADGDGAPELLIGARGFADVSGAGGAAFLYPANGGQGPTRLYRQRRTDNAGPIARLGRADAPHGFRIDGKARSAAGRVDVRFDAEAQPLGTPFGGGIVSGAWIDPGAPAAGVGSRADVLLEPTGLPTNAPVRWRARARARSPYFPTSPWIVLGNNAATEADLRTGTLGASTPEPSAPPGLRLTAAPIPFRESTTLSFTLNRAAHVEVRIYDAAGRLVRTLTEGRATPGHKSLPWNGRDASNLRVSSGVYFARLDVEGTRDWVRLVHLR